MELHVAISGDKEWRTWNGEKTLVIIIQTWDFSGEEVVRLWNDTKLIMCDDRC